MIREEAKGTSSVWPCLRDAQLPGAAVPAAAPRVQALPRLGGRGCQGGLSAEGGGFILK